MEILNTQRFEKLKTIFKERNINLSLNDISIYSNVFEIISQFVHHKLTDEEILGVYDLLSDVIKNDRPDIVAHVSKNDRIRVQVRLMEELPETKGKLDLDEKIALAFCIYLGECTQIYDEEKNSMHNGIVLFDSFEHIQSELDYEKEQFPSVYKLDKPEIKFDDTYGYSLENPINTTSIDASYYYLTKLRYNGSPIIYERIGSFGNSKNDTIDGYDIFIEKKTLFGKKTIKIATLYINAYCDGMPKVAPKGFELF